MQDFAPAANQNAQITNFAFGKLISTKRLSRWFGPKFWFANGIKLSFDPKIDAERKYKNDTSPKMWL